MPIDPASVKWDEPAKAATIDPSSVQWDDEKGSRQRAQEQSDGRLTADAKAVLPGLLRGFNRGVSTAGDVLSKIMPDSPRYQQQREQFDRLNAESDATNKGNPGYSLGDFGGKVLVTSPVGGVLAAPLKAVPALAPFADSVATAGFRAGGAKGLGNLLTRSAGGAVTGGASGALIDPQDALGGAIVGGALPVVAKATGLTGHGILNAFRPGGANSELASKAINQYGIPLGAADISGNAFVKGARSVLNDVPVIGSIGARQKQGVQAGFNQAVGNTFGANAKSLTPQVMDSAKKNLGAEFDRIWGKNDLPYDGQLFQDIQGLRANADKLPNGEGARLKSWLDDVEGKMQPDGQGNLLMPGDTANRMQSKLRQDAEKANGFLADDLQTLRKNLLGAFSRNVSAADAQALKATQGKYKAMKTVEPLVNSAEAGVAGRNAGDVPAALLPQAVVRSYGANIAGSPFEDLSQIGSQFVADRVARTGGSARAMVQNSALGTLLAGGLLKNPIGAAAAIPAAAGSQYLLGSPRVANALLGPTQRPTARELLEAPGAPQWLYRSLPAGTSGGR